MSSIAQPAKLHTYVILTYLDTNGILEIQEGQLSYKEKCNTSPIIKNDTF